MTEKHAEADSSSDAQLQGWHCGQGWGAGDLSAGTPSQPEQGEVCGHLWDPPYPRPLAMERSPAPGALGRTSRHTAGRPEQLRMAGDLGLASWALPAMQTWQSDASLSLIFLISNNGGRNTVFLLGRRPQNWPHDLNC